MDEFEEFLIVAARWRRRCSKEIGFPWLTNSLLSTISNIMPAAALLVSISDQKRLALLGERIRTARKRQR